MRPDTSPEPFEPTSDPDTYLPRPATEEALGALASYLRVGATQVFLTGPSGIGKSILMRVLAARLDPRWRAVFVPYPALPPEEIASWILGLMGEPPGSDPERTLINHARRLRDTSSGLAILVDDAASMPLPTVRRLSRLSMEARPALPLVLALPDDERCAEVADAIGPGVEVVLLEEPMSADETRSYLEARLLRAEVPEEEREVFLRDSAEAIHRDSLGVPHSVNSAAAASWRRFHVQRDGDHNAGPADPEANWRLGSALLGPSGPEVVDPWLEDTQIGETVALDSIPADTAAAGEETVVEAAPVLAPILELDLEPEFEGELEIDAPVDAVAAESPPPHAAMSSGTRVLLSAVVVVALLLAFGLGRLSAQWPGSPLPAVSAGLPAVDPAREGAAERQSASEGFTTAMTDGPVTGDVEVDEVPVDNTTFTDPEFGVSEPGEAQQGELAEIESGAESGLTDPFSRGDLEGEAEETTVRVSINAVPWAEIEVNGEPVGITPLADLPLERGTHLFRATFPDGRTVERVETVTTLNRRVLFR